MLNFPDSPTLNQVFSDDDISWRWDGTKWVVGEVQGEFVLKAGDQMSGPLHMLGGASPTAPVLLIGSWTDVSTDTSAGLNASLYIDHRYNHIGDPPPTFGLVASPITGYFVIEGTPSYHVWGINMQMFLQTDSEGGYEPYVPQHVGYAITTQRRSGADAGFLYYGMMENLTGRTGMNDIGFELDIRCNGPDGSTSRPETGGRTLFQMAGISEDRYAGWDANHAYAKDAVIQVGGHTYYAQIAGTSGPAAPAWPTSGTVIDGTVTWAYGTTIAAQISRALGIFTSGAMAFGAGVLLQGNFYDAPIDMAYANLDFTANPWAAGIRLRSNMPIDFSGERPAPEGQNFRILYWNNVSHELTYATGDGSLSVGGGGGLNGFTRFAIHDDGNIRIQVPWDAPDDTAAAAAGVPPGGLYRNGSVLMVRVMGSP